jgi:hypothetical protein
MKFFPETVAIIMKTIMIENAHSSATESWPTDIKAFFGFGSDEVDEIFTVRGGEVDGVWFKLHNGQIRNMRGEVVDMDLAMFAEARDQRSDARMLAQRAFIADVRTIMAVSMEQLEANGEIGPAERERPETFYGFWPQDVVKIETGSDPEERYIFVLSGGRRVDQFGQEVGESEVQSSMRTGQWKGER